jgi:hypothetical protein
LAKKLDKLSASCFLLPFQNEIKMVLSESVSRSQSSGPCDINQQLSRRRKELASFMGSLLEEMAKAEATKVGISSESTSVLGKCLS